MAYAILGSIGLAITLVTILIAIGRFSARIETKLDAVIERRPVWDEAATLTLKHDVRLDNHEQWLTALSRHPTPHGAAE